MTIAEQLRALPTSQLLALAFVPSYTVECITEDASPDEVKATMVAVFAEIDRRFPAGVTR